MGSSSQCLWPWNLLFIFPRTRCYLITDASHSSSSLLPRQPATQHMVCGPQELFPVASPCRLGHTDPALTHFLPWGPCFPSKAPHHHGIGEYSCILMWTECGNCHFPFFTCLRLASTRTRDLCLGSRRHGIFLLCVAFHIPS